MLTSVVADATKVSGISMKPSVLIRLDNSVEKSFGRVSRPSKNTRLRISQIRSFR